MKRVALALALVAMAGCKKTEQTPPPADTTNAPAAAPAMSDSARIADSTRMANDSAKAAVPAKKPN